MKAGAGPLSALSKAIRERKRLHQEYLGKIEQAPENHGHRLVIDPTATGHFPVASGRLLLGGHARPHVGLDIQAQLQGESKTDKNTRLANVMSQDKTARPSGLPRRTASRPCGRWAARQARSHQVAGRPAGPSGGVPPALLPETLELE